MFSPARSITRNQFENEAPKWIIRKPAMADNWSACLQTLEGHSSWVKSVAWSHDATRLASASEDKTIKIWDPATGQCVSTLEGHSDSVNSVAWSHDASRLASASEDKTVKIWDSATGQCMLTFQRVSTFNEYRTVRDLAIDRHVLTRQRVSTLEISQVLLNLQSHAPNSSLLRTTPSTFDLETATVSDPAFTDCSSPITLGYGLSRDGTWITYQEVNLLWLPPEYRPLSSAISRTVMSIGCSSGCVLIFTFADNNQIL